MVRKLTGPTRMQVSVSTCGYLQPIEKTELSSAAGRRRGNCAVWKAVVMSLLNGAIPFVAPEPTLERLGRHADNDVVR